MRALLVAALLLLAGCVVPDPPAPEPEDEPASDATARPRNTTGTIIVVARFTDLAPLSGVNVTLANRSQLTGPDGVARFLDVPAGAHLVHAAKTAHRAAQASVEARVGEEVVVELVLAPEEGGHHAHKPGFEGHKDLYRFEGHFDCSATYVIITGDCLIVVENVSRTLGRPDPSGNTTSERHVIDFPLDVGWASLVVEMNWTKPRSSLSSGMTLALEPAEAPADGHAAKYARVEGASPLRIDLVPGQKHATATLEDKPNPSGGEVIRARAFVMGLGHRAAGQPALGVGASLEHRFTLHVSVFYGEAAPAGYSALG